MVILNTLIFVFVSTFVVYALANPLLSSNRATGNILESKRAFLVAGSAAEETLYKLKTNKTVQASETLTLGGVSASISTATAFGERVIQVSSEVEDVTRRLEVAVSESAGVSFNYGLQTGQGGFELYGGARVNGNLYSNGNVVGFGGATVTGSVTVANGSDPILNQSNGTVGTTTNSLIFGGQLVYNDQKPQDAAQSFRVSTTTAVTSVRIYIRKYANISMNDITVRITNDTSGRPGSTTYASAVLPSSQITTSYNYITVPFTTTPSLNTSNTYWLVLDTDNTWNSYYLWGANQNGYANGQAKLGTCCSASWSNPSPTGLDGYFDIYVGGAVGRITGNQNDRLTIGGNAWANQISGTNITGTMHCQGSSYTNKTCDVSRPDPVQQPFPISDGNINDWKAEAEAGGVQNGNVTIGWQGGSIGPKKVVGNLTVSSGGTLIVNGALWVTGNITVDGGGTIKLGPGYAGNSGVIVTDGRIVATGGGDFEGNGTAGNYILVITTSQCPTGCGSNNAITVSGGSGSVILNAQQGTVRMTGGATAKQLTAKKVIMDGGTTVNYETGLQDMSFDSGPSGSWSISGWGEI